MSLYREVDLLGNSIDILLSLTRAAKSTKCFFGKALRARHIVAPGVINVDRNPTCPKALGKPKGKDTLPQGYDLRHARYLVSEG